MEQYDKQKGNARAAVTSGSLNTVDGDTIAKKSGENEQAKLDSGKGGGTANIVSAPSITNNNSTTAPTTRVPPRNNDSTVNKYMQSRWAF